jgi:hypothetical protein
VENRRYKRINIDVPIHVEGIDLEGNTVREETFAINISGTGVLFVSTRDYNSHKKLTVTVRLIYPLGKDVPAGTWQAKANIVRFDNVIREPSGKLKKQNVAVNFDYLLASTPSPNPWKDIIY